MELRLELAAMDGELVMSVMMMLMMVMLMVLMVLMMVMMVTTMMILKPKFFVLLVASLNILFSEKSFWLLAMDGPSHSTPQTMYDL